MDARLAPEPLIFVDLETTGANFANDRIIEIGVVSVDEEGAREWSSLVDPGSSISPFITGLTGINDRMVAGAPTFEQLAPRLIEMLRGRLFIAHNARFDYGFLKREFARLGVNFRAPTLCTVKLSRKLFSQHHRHNLDTLVERHGIQVADRHRALADARVLWDLWRCWHETLTTDVIRSAVDALVGRPELPAQLDASVIDDLPESPGAYALYGEDGGQLLVRRSKNIRQQVLAHFSSPQRDSVISRSTWRIDWRETAGELGARLQELLLSHDSGQAAEDLCAWRLMELDKGDFQPQLVYARDLDFGTTDDLFGLYLKPREAIQSLRKIADAHALCYRQLGLGETAKGLPCVAYKQKSCRGACIGKEAVSLHSVRTMAALAKFKLKPWPYRGPIALVERDEFGTREDFHIVDRWRYVGTANNEDEFARYLESAGSREFDPDVYRLVNKFLQAGKVRVLPLPAPALI